ncbi:MAG: acetate--CoA ligase family protein [Bacteroidales bacterium]|nr:acetate--CoA ligase family protein [Bacteroidales bacterium]
MTFEFETEKNLETARQLLEKIKEQISDETRKIEEFKMKMYRENDFKCSKFKAYTGPNYYLPKKALVFNIFIAPVGDSVNFYKEHVAKVFPKALEWDTPHVIDLFCKVLLETLKMNIDLYLNDYSISMDGDDYVVAIEYLDKNVAIDCVYLVSDWFYALSYKDGEFDFVGKWQELQQKFDRTLYGGPTLYSLIEAGLKRNIPIIYLYEENQFMWGYGKKQLRGRSTTFHNDGIKDTEFTMYKDMVGEFLEKCGFPTPKSFNCFTEKEVLDAVKKLGFPLVIKPVAGHKGQGVTTGIENEQQALEAFNKIVKAAQEEGVNFDGALVQQQIYGTDHRLLAVNGKFVAALERVPAYVIGDGTHTIEELIHIENQKEIRADTARSPLCKIKIDDNLIEFLKLQNLSLKSVPKEGERVVLRRVANISAGGVSINVTDKIHPANVKLVEDIASFFLVRCLGIDVLAKDISKPWYDGDFGIIEINAGPGVFMHLAPAYGGSIDVPGMIIMSHFKRPENARIPIIGANYVSQEFANKLNRKLHEIKPSIFFGSITRKGIYFNGEYFYNNPHFDASVEVLLRHPKLDFALIASDIDDIFDYGLVYQGADLIILDEPYRAEEDTLLKQLLPGGYVVNIEESQIYLKQNNEVLNTTSYDVNNPDDKEDKLLTIIEPILYELVNKYEYND